MEMTDMKLPRKSKEEMKKEMASCMPMCEQEQDRWPYGLQLRFEKDEIAKLPALKGYKVGDKVIISAEAKVTDTRVSERTRGGEVVEDHTIEMQIEKISCEPKVKKKPEEMSMKEYKEMRMSK